MSTPEEVGGEQPFVSHLVELRDRLIRMVFAILAVFFVLFPFRNDLYTFVAAPVQAILPEGVEMIAFQMTSPFLIPLKLTLVLSVFLAMPYLLSQFWAFVAPGLYKHEKRLAVPLLVSSTVLFYLGMVFAYYVVFPLVFRFFASVTPEGVTQMPDISYYLEFVLKLFFAFGIAFEIPVATFLLVAVGATTPDSLAAKRPYVIVGVFIAGMLLTPPDVISQTLLAVPMWLLFELGILFARLFLRQKETDGGDDDEPSAASNGGDSRPPSGPTDSRGGSHDYTPMTEDEMEAELDEIEAADWEEKARAKAPSFEEQLSEINRLRRLGDGMGARDRLYRILAEGDEDQCRIARAILEQLDRA